MASSGVWENVNLTITPTFDGVCGMLFFIIILVGIVFAKCWHVCHRIVFLNMLGQLFLMLDVTDVVVTIGLQPLDAVGRCYLPCGCGMADVFCNCGRWNSHFCLFVEDENHI